MGWWVKIYSYEIAFVAMVEEVKAEYTVTLTF